MALDLWAVSTAVARAAETLPYVGQGYEYEPENPVAPCAIVRWPVVPLLGETFGTGTLRVEGELLLLPGEVIDAAAAKRLHGWLSAGSAGVRAKLEADPTLGGLVNQLVVRDAAEVGLVSSPILGERYGATVRFEIVARRD